MGQISYPILNRFGYSMYWNNMWDNISCYNKFLLKSLFFNNFFFNFFNFFLSLNFFFYTKHFNSNALTARQQNQGLIQNFDSKKIKKPNELYKEVASGYLSGRVGILVFNGWYIISINLYLLEQRIPEDNAKSDDSDSSDPHLLDDYMHDFFFIKII